ncbi:MAG: ribosome silencing factor [Candidatus Muiribacteriaceae bacterium]
MGLTELIVKTLEDKKAQDISVHKAPEGHMTDEYVICTGTSDTHIRTLNESLKKSFRDNRIDLLYFSDRNISPEWIVLDAGEVIIHIMTEEKRSHYELEDLWEEYRAEEEGVSNVRDK